MTILNPPQPGDSRNVRQYGYRQIPEYARRADANQPALVKLFRTLGCSVQHLHRVGEGCPDLLVGIWGLNFLVEVKDGSKPPSKRELNDKQVLWHSKWTGHKCVVINEDEAIDLVNYGKAMARALQKAGLL